jgi:predicted RNase H-like HicB family nuclease
MLNFKNMATVWEYMSAAMRHAVIERIGDENEYYGHIPEFVGLWATGAAEEEARQELYSALDGWLHENAFHGTQKPPRIDGLSFLDPPQRIE